VSTKRKTKPTILLAGGEDRSMLSAARALGRHDVPYLVLGIGASSFVGASRYVRGHIVERGPKAGSDPEAYVAFLLDIVRRYDVQLVLPLTDRTLLACDWHREAIEAKAQLATASSTAVRNVNDKRAHLAMARRLGVPCPENVDMTCLEEVPRLIETLGFPIVLKDPGPSVDAIPSPFSFTWLIAWDEAELQRLLAEHCRSGQYPIFQRLAVGIVRNVCCFAVGGEIVAIAEYRDLRRLGGLSVFREMTPISPELLGYAESILRELRWDGAAHLEFFVDECSGDIRYMETNGRFWASIEGPVRAGWNFPLWTYEYFAKGEVPQPPRASRGVGLRSCWHYGDLVAVLRFLRGEYEPTGAGRSKIRALTDYISGFSPAVASDVFRLTDPLPEIVEHWWGGRLALSRFRHRNDPDRLPDT